MVMKKKYIVPQVEVIVFESKQSLMVLSDPEPPGIGSREDDFWVNFEYNSDDLKQISE
jgi:hypothetical protein